MPLLVQQELQAGTYRFVVGSADSTCSWMIQGVLNSMLGDDAPPSPAPLPVARDRSIATFSSNDQAPLSLHLSDTGIYDISWRMQVSDPGQPCAHTIDLVGSDGRTVHLEDGGPPSRGITSTGNDGPRLLPEGSWQLRVVTPCRWDLAITPWFGNLGGGAAGFSAG
jgi:hypothetical protein